MIVIDVTVPHGRFSTDERRGLARALNVRDLLRLDDGNIDHADPGVLELYESLTHVVVREADAWIAAGEPAETAEAAPYLVDVRVGAFGREMAGHLIGRITDQIGRFDGDTERPRREPTVLVHVFAIGEGAYGVYGEPLKQSGFTSMIAEAKRNDADAAPEGMLVDPLCGAIVAEAEAVMLERDGQTYGFCCTHCRGHFAKQLKAEGQLR
ncbi:MAG TPA: hypothetical protein VE172_10170 [Stackebrandtia sp.]|jgi:YHS domain-containing protein|uniref:hypothetical protein n=1 Tax=Stackebrandtia sp. TaxID=2023065 RepID=UPI002D6CDBFD|nr:hypothetical protein [Stackebrandtia sp.]HZE39163.1 hypothetical protein [Stackebrandtia sp.]